MFNPIQPRQHWTSPNTPCSPTVWPPPSQRKEPNNDGQSHRWACSLLHNPQAHNEAGYQANKSRLTLEWPPTPYPPANAIKSSQTKYQVRIPKARNPSAHFPDLDFAWKHPSSLPWPVLYWCTTQDQGQGPPFPLLHHQRWKKSPIPYIIWSFWLTWCTGIQGP